MTADIPSGSSSVRWNAVGLAGRQIAVLTLAVVLAAILGPQAYGIMAQAQVFITLTTLILDQGMSAALVQRRELPRAVARAVAGLNFVLSLVLAALTLLLAPFLADFFNTPELTYVLYALGTALVIKGIGVVPRALLVRNLQFQKTALADVASVIVGGVSALVAAAFGASYWSLVIQTVVGDIVATALLLAFARGPGLSFRLGDLAGTFGFSLRVFLSNLISYTSRNTDNILVGRAYGAADLGYYSLAYRVLLTPVQMVAQVVVQVLFPHISRLDGERERIQLAVSKSVRTLATVVFPAMAGIAATAPLAVPLVLGADWSPAVPVLMVLAFTGARQALTAISSPLLLAAGAVSVQLRFSIIAAAAQVGGIVAGLPFGILGVAWGYTVGGLLVTPIVVWQVKKFSGVSYRGMLGLVAPPAHASLWLIAAYTASTFLPLTPWWSLIIGILCGAVAYLLSLVIAHNRYARLFLADVARVIRPDAH